MSVSSNFSNELVSEFKKTCSNFIQCKKFLFEVEQKNEITLIFIYLYMCKLTDEIDIKNKYSRKANSIYLKYFKHKDNMLNEFDWAELELYKYNLSEIFNYDVYCLKDNVVINTGRCLFKEYDVLFYRYKIECQIGKGTYSNVYKCYDFKRKQHIALKAIRNDTKFINSGDKEITVLQKLKHKSICNYIKYFKIEKHHFIVFELQEGNIYQYVKSTRFSPMKPKLVNQIAKQLIPVLVYIKSVNVIHADIKPENILVKHVDDENITVKLSDFGSAMKKHKNCVGYIVSRYYRAPEIVLEKYGGCDYLIDMWSFSTIVYELLMGKPLFPAKTEKELIYSMFKELGYPHESFLSDCRKRNFLESQVEDTFCDSFQENIIKVKFIDTNAYEFLCASLIWEKEKRLTCDDAMNHKYLLN